MTQTHEAGTWLRREGAALRRPLRRAAALSALQALALVAQAWLLAWILNAALFAHATLRTCAPALLALLLLAPLRLAAQLGARRVAHAAALGWSAAIRTRLLERTRALGPLGLRAAASGELITRLVDGVDALLPYAARYLPQTLTAALVPLLLAAAVLPADWISGLILLFTAPLIPLFMGLVGSAAERASRRRYAELSRLGAAFIDALSGLATLRELGAAEGVAAQLADDGEGYRRATMQVLRVAFLSALVLEFFATVSIAVVAVLIGFRLLWHELAFRDGLFVLLLAPEFYAPLRALGALRHARMDALAAAAPLAALEQAPLRSPPLAGGAAPAPDAAPRVSLVDLRYAPDGRGPVLDGLDLELPAGRVTVLVGATGAGKSSLLNLLLGFAAPQHGHVRIDGAELTSLDLDAWRARIAWVPQQAHVFAGTLADNLRLARPQAERADLDAVAIDVGLAAALTRLPRGWDTVLGEHGEGLSGGELQRLALARALLRRDARVLLLDEPTAHLDADSARRIGQVLRAAACGRTVLWVAHRLDAALAADRVAVLQDGRVAECAPPADLLRAGGAFAALHAAECAS